MKTAGMRFFLLCGPFQQNDCSYDTMIKLNEIWKGDSKYDY